MSSTRVDVCVMAEVCGRLLDGRGIEAGSQFLLGGTQRGGAEGLIISLSMLGA